MKSRLSLYLVLAGALTTGCFWSKKKTAHRPPAVHPTQAPKPAASRPAPARPDTKASRPGSPVPVASPPPPESLGQMLSAGDQAELSRSLNRSLANARSALAAASRRKLNSDEAEKLKLANTFVSQAERARSNDLPVAARLARRAELIAQSLLQ